MGTQRVVEILGGAAAVYLAMVACAADPRPSSPAASAGAAGELAASAGEPGRPIAAGGAPNVSAGGQGGLLVGAGGETLDGSAGLFSNPTPDAGAQEAGAGPGPETCECPDPPVVPDEITWERFDVDCEVQPETGDTVRFALLDLPDVSELRRVRTYAVMNGAADLHARLGFNAYSLGSVLLRADGVGLQCQIPHADFPSVSFYVPSR